MQNIQYFDPLNTPLEGTNLVEASAGTGKTYTITALFLRLILEKNFSLDEILVVTFTEAATCELKERIRSTLRKAVLAFSENRSEDPFLGDLVKKTPDSDNALRYLREALRTFDQAAIFTIHGFCRRMLFENAFESGTLFDTELVTEGDYLKAEIVEDFWRNHFYRTSPLFVSYLLTKKMTPSDLITLLGNRTAQPYLKIIPQQDRVDPSPQEEAFKASFMDLSSAWPSSKKEVEEILLSYDGLNRSLYRPGHIPGWIEGMDRYAASGGHAPVLFRGFDKFTLNELKRGTKKDYHTPKHPFFECCEAHKQKESELHKFFERHLLNLKIGLFEYGRRELAGRKAEKNIYFFDDLLLQVHQALEGPTGKRLAAAIKREFKAALIDEFQDTDPIQYAILEKVFGHDNSILFLIGDPKQAIYGFRGADIFSYMEAARNVASRFTLKDNWRSEPLLITAVNTLFSHASRPFIYDEISFHPVDPANSQDMESLNMMKKGESPMQIWFLDSAGIMGDGKVITKALAKERIPVAVAGEISRLLHMSRKHKVFIGKRALREEDIAVLVRKNVEAHLVQEALSALYIPSVLHSTLNLFDSDEAMEMGRLLAAIVEPSNEKIIKAALTTDILGLKGEEIDPLMEVPSRWERWLVAFREYHRLWRQRGFIRMFRSLTREENLLVRLMRLPNGERRCTNLLHLSEVLHQVSVEKKLNMSGLLKWLLEQRDPRSPRTEEHQLRLESDENAVKIVTIHKSKGLEFPIVFCPFGWEGSKIRRSIDPFTFHDENDGRRLTLDLGSEDMTRNRASAEVEGLAENLRLLYVALTRAKNRCYLVWGRLNEAETSALAYLFHHTTLWETGGMVRATGKRFKELSDEDLLQELEAVRDKARGAIHLSKMPLEEPEPYSASIPKRLSLSLRKFSGQIDRQWRISSFSSLLSGMPHQADVADRDEAPLLPESESSPPQETESDVKPSGIFAFPKGTKAGIFLHDLMEHLDFTQRDAAVVKDVVNQKLKEFGFEQTWEETLFQMIQKVWRIPLSPSVKGLSLSRIPNQDRINELEFYFPLTELSPKKLRGLFVRHLSHHAFQDFPERIERLDFSPTQGFMKGFIDMVFQYGSRFYLVDWKSNFLGSKTEDYSQDALSTVMKDRFYILQYHLYTVALCQYLKLRIPGYDYQSHFGGVYYIFLRGIDPEKGPDFGIYRDRPSGECVKDLCDHLIFDTISATKTRRRKERM
ncbi:MAG: exodeoxyribonuclease V subunit beta [Pseudomonadota bacterium]